MASPHIHHVHGSSGSMGYSLGDFYPLIGVLTVVVVLSAAGIFLLGQDPMLAFMGYFFLVFGGLKAIRLKGFADAYQEYDLLAMRSRTYALAYPFVELAFGVSYLLAWQVTAVSAVVLFIMLVGALGVYLKLRQGEEIPCACLGAVFKVPMTWVTLGEDLVMALMALAFLVY